MALLDTAPPADVPADSGTGGGATVVDDLKVDDIINAGVSDQEPAASGSLNGGAGPTPASHQTPTRRSPAERPQAAINSELAGHLTCAAQGGLHCRRIGWH